jgi:predicted glycosyltransferase
MNSSANVIWIDLDNSPHVVFFAPIIRELENRGYRIALTVRDCFQVCGLADLNRMRYSRVGRHYGKHKVLKATGTILRSFQLYKSLVKTRPSLALSHGSRSQLIASKMLRVRTVTIGDYEYVKGLPFISPDVFIVPELILNNCNWHAKRIEKYPGIKEDVYVPDFVPDGGILKELGLNEKNIVVTIRPPATEAHYHNPESEILFTEVVNFLGSMEGVQMVVLPRNEREQGDLIRSRWPTWCHERKMIIPERVVDGLNLIWHSDLVVSGGGTMNREAAALGVPVYSIFRGKIGAVDNYLAKVGRLTLIESPEDVKDKILPVARQRPKGTGQKDRTTLTRIVEVIEAEMESLRSAQRT